MASLSPRFRMCSGGKMSFFASSRYFGTCGLNSTARWIASTACISAMERPRLAIRSGENLSPMLRAFSSAEPITQSLTIVLGEQRLHVGVRLHLQQRLNEVLVNVEEVDHGKLLDDVAHHLHRLAQFAQLAGAHCQPAADVDEHVQVAAVGGLVQRRLVVGQLRPAVRGLGHLQAVSEDPLRLGDRLRLLVGQQNVGGGAVGVLRQRLLCRFDARLGVTFSPGGAPDAAEVDPDPADPAAVAAADDEDEPREMCPEMR
ncbi:hypothetical protein TYRP_009947 [Tyrophagus putrescentiae]|nr:hypothetical protein TYRP_009947 [Tyrophagus putrescentiae]